MRGQIGALNQRSAHIDLCAADVLANDTFGSCCWLARKNSQPTRQADRRTSIGSVGRNYLDVPCQSPEENLPQFEGSLKRSWPPMGLALTRVIYMCNETR